MKVSSTPQMPRTSMWRLYYKKPEAKPYQCGLSHGEALLLAEVVIDEGEQHPPGQAARHALGARSTLRWASLAAAPPAHIVCSGQAVRLEAQIGMFLLRLSPEPLST